MLNFNKTVVLHQIDECLVVINAPIDLPTSSPRPAMKRSLHDSRYRERLGKDVQERSQSALDNDDVCADHGYRVAFDLMGAVDD